MINVHTIVSPVKYMDNNRIYKQWLPSGPEADLLQIQDIYPPTSNCVWHA